MSDRIYLSPPDVGDAEKHAVMAAMEGGWIAPLGPEVDAFEAELAARVCTKHGVALSSGTAALHLALLSVGVKPGDFVVTSTMTFAATTNAIVYTGAQPFFVDCLPESGNIDPELLRVSLTRLRAEGAKIAAILPVDLLGKTVDYTAVLEIADEFEVPVIADAAESLGASHRGRPAGSFGAASIFSFNGNKIMTTSGGGMLMTDDDNLEHHARYLATQARQPVPYYQHHDVGYNYRMSNLLAALGRAQLGRLDDMIQSRREVRARYQEFFAKIDGIELFGADDDEEDNFWLTSIIVDSKVTGWDTQALVLALAQQNIEARAVWKPMHLQPVFEHYRGEINGVSERLFHSLVSLPSGSTLHQEQQQRVFDEIERFIRR